MARYASLTKAHGLVRPSNDFPLLRAWRASDASLRMKVATVRKMYELHHLQHLCSLTRDVPLRIAQTSDDQGWQHLPRQELPWKTVALKRNIQVKSRMYIRLLHANNDD